MMETSTKRAAAAPTSEATATAVTASASASAEAKAAKRFRFDSFATEFASNPTSPKNTEAADTADNDSGIGEPNFQLLGHFQIPYDSYELP